MSQRVETIVLILARVGSKGLAGKNLRPIAGRPCVQWTIDEARRALEANVASAAAISTDGEALQRLGLDAGLDVVERPAELASDGARVDDAARHAVLALEARGRKADAVAILYANVPVRPAGLIERAVRMLADSGADSVQSYAPVGKHHPWWTAVVGADGMVRAWEGDQLNHGVFRRQDLPPAHQPDGGVLAVRRAALMLEIPGVQEGPHAFLGRDRRGVVCEEGAVIDIDSEVDALVAEALLTRRARGGAAA